MKAKDLAAKHKIRPEDDPSKDALIDGLVDCAQEMVREISTIVKARRIKRGESTLAVIREQDDKFNALVRISVEKNKKFELIGDMSTIFRRVLKLSLEKTPDVWLLTCQNLGWDVDYALYLEKADGKTNGGNPAVTEDPRSLA
jgi:hypothetical protein